MDRNKIQVADIGKIISRDRITHSSHLNQASKTTTANMAANHHLFEKNNHRYQNCEASFFSSHIMTEKTSRAIQPASLATTTTCTTIQSAAMRQRKCLTRVQSVDSKKANTAHAKLIAILGPLVVYSLFQVTANLLLTHNNANNHNQQTATIASHTSSPHNFYAKSVGAAHYEHCCSSFKSHQQDAYLRHLIVRQNNQLQEHFHGTISLESSNNDETGYQEDQASRSSQTESSQAEKNSALTPLHWRSLLSELMSASTYLYNVIERVSTRPIFGPKVLMAEAAVELSPVLAQQNREIIVLNSTNFNTELIQHEHPFPHIKLIEYYLSYCGICLKFKPTYTELAHEIFSWRNVIRMSAIDLGVSSNSPIAYSWSVDVVPTLRLHPPPSEEFASQLATQLSSWSSKLNSRELQKSIYEEYNGTKLMIKSLEVIKYTNDGKGGESSVTDKVSLLKLDLLHYIESYVSENSNALPPTWPNLRPVKEKSLSELRRHHPRQELFLIIEADLRGDLSQSPVDNSQAKRSLTGLSVMMELSSSASWQAIRYVRASENRELIEDVIAHKRREADDKTQDGQAINDNQIDLLESLISNKQQQPNDGNNNNIVLIHIDYSHSPVGRIRAPSKFPFITIVTGSDLTTVEQSAQFDQQQQSGGGGRARRAINHLKNGNGLPLAKRSLFSSSSDELNGPTSLQRKVELVALYINQTYTETKEDREFVRALSKLDADPTSSVLKREVAEVSKVIGQSNQELMSNKLYDVSTLESNNASNIGENGIKSNSSLVEASDQARGSFMSWATTNSPSSSINFNANIDILINDQDPEDDYEDKLKAIRYIFFQEIPRKSLNEKSLVEKQERLSTLLNFVSVIKAYFPLPDASSMQFIDGIQNYLMRQQQTLLNLRQTSPSASGNIGFDTRALKQELRRLESEGKRLPEIKDWKHCKFGGYSCALWRLFHTLTAFEYKKLIQINQLSQVKQQLPPQILPDNQSTLLTRVDQGVDQQPTAASLSSSLNHEQQQQSQHNSPVERLVSPPSTTTSLSLTIATPIASHHIADNNSSSNKRLHELDLLPPPVLLVMRDYVTQFFSCDDCARKFRLETADLSFERIRQHEPAEFSILWLWETHNRVSKRLSINPESNPPEHPKKWFPTYNQCQKCYRRPPSYLKEINMELAAIFHESIEWNREEVLIYLLCQYTRQPMDNLTNIFGYQVPYGVVLIITCSLVLIVLLRCASCYIERQRRHKASLLNGNGYSMELQRNS